VAQAVRRLRAREIDRCIVGGIDTFVHGAPLADVHELGLLRTEQKPVGFFPGEAAGFVLLERADAARARGARAEALLSAAALTEESFGRFSGVPPQGAALTAVAEACLREPQARPGLVIVNLNGDEFRARDFGTALVRLRGAVLPDGFRQWFPPASFGETGAATGAASVCMAVRGFSRDYAGSRAALVLLLGDDEARGAVLIEDLPPTSGQAR
jgi:3-oxoacyl-[acyl-carrier-protein] synthase-1